MDEDDQLARAAYWLRRSKSSLIRMATRDLLERLKAQSFTWSDERGKQVHSLPGDDFPPIPSGAQE